MAASRLARAARRAGPVAAWAVIGAVAALQTLWMLLLGLAMALGNPLGAPDSAWRTAAGVGIGCSAVLFGAGLGAAVLGRRAEAAAGLAAGAALYWLLYLAYPRALGEPLLWAALLAPALGAAAAACWWLAGRRAGDADSPDGPGAEGAVGADAPVEAQPSGAWT